MRDIIDYLNYHTKLYNEGHPIISDKEWDDAYFKLVEMERETGIVYPDSPTQVISYDIKSELNKVTHNHKMLSLKKTKDWNEFLNYFNSNKDVIGMLKLDGLTCSLRYVDGHLVSAETRGNGEVGEDILHNTQVIKSIPKMIPCTDELIIDGEIICTYKDFEHFENDYANPRNFASGSIRLLDPRECEKRNLTFVAWNVVKGFDETNSFMKKMFLLKDQGFTITPLTSSFDWDAKEFLINQAKELYYPIDGLVGRYDDISYGTSLGETDHHSKAAYAFKFYDEEYETHLLDIEWSMGSRSGVLTPVAIFEPVYDGESIVERASLHNINIMEEILDKPYIGQKIWVTKRNQIIPNVEKAEKWDNLMNNIIFLDIPEVCPICGGPVSIVTSDSGTQNLVCDNPQCPGKLVNQIEHFCSKDKGLDIKGISTNTLNKLVNWEWVSSIKDIYNLKNYRIEWINKTGFGKKSVDNILNSIEKSKKCELWRFISALGIPLIGNNVSKDLANYFKSWDAFISAINEGFDFEELPNFGYAMNKSLYDFDWLLAEEIIKTGELEILSVINNDDNKNNNLNGITIVITGKLNNFKNRDELKAKIESFGGKVASGVTAKTSILINNDVNSTSAKNVAANKLGIPIMSEENFIKSFDIL